MRASLKKSILFSLAALSLGLSISASATPASAEPHFFHGGAGDRGFRPINPIHPIRFWGGHRFGFGGGGDAGFSGVSGVSGGGCATGCDYAGQNYSDGAAVNGKVCVTGVWQ
jgi:hypothetical protein